MLDYLSLYPVIKSADSRNVSSSNVLTMTDIGMRVRRIHKKNHKIIDCENVGFCSFEFGSHVDL